MTYDVLTKKTWISLSTGDELNLRGEQIIASQWNRRSFYNNVRISSNKCVVLAMGPSMEHIDIYVKSIQSVFKRICKITIKNRFFIVPVICLKGLVYFVDKCSIYWDHFTITLNHQYTMYPLDIGNNILDTVTTRTVYKRESH